MSVPLLRWGIENSDADALREEAQAKNQKKFDPELIEFILGKDDAVRIKEAVEVIESEEQTMEDRLVAFENLQMLTEQIDNAMSNIMVLVHTCSNVVDVGKMHLWPRIMSLLQHQEEGLRKMALWVMATCAQNNPTAQEHLLTEGSLDKAFHLLSTDPSIAVRRKALAVISALIQHYAPGLAAFKALDGFRQLEGCLLQDGKDENISTRTGFLLRALLEEDPSLAVDLYRFPLLLSKLE